MKDIILGSIQRFAVKFLGNWNLCGVVQMLKGKLPRFEATFSITLIESTFSEDFICTCAIPKRLKN